MAKPIFVISLGLRLSAEAYQSMKALLNNIAELKKEYHILIFDGDPKGNQYHVLNGEFDDIIDLEEYINQINEQTHEQSAKTN